MQGKKSRGKIFLNRCLDIIVTSCILLFNLILFQFAVGQEDIGTVDVKTKPTHFYVQRDKAFSAGNAIIPFQLSRLNEGNAFDLASGIFTVSVPGIYYFNFSGVKLTTSTYLYVWLQVNGVDVSYAYTGQSVTGTYDVVSLSASLRLAEGDTVNLFNYGYGVLADDYRHTTHFTGWLVEEDLM